ncbi:(2Fe-2S) ferredoxin domain-containing protein [Gloeobacter violaceus]|uniref:Gll2565 protein n=1 Tax=Gloeobacter violaceus (strain ATCC 29082 / PCC 7421) TaxID=251221 RepID=Q7NHH2_GLOVI|nr:OB-fold nucleic acid binding domain-containing protein [Gloeobacter violaceus]BAC90506.1 gll2565 [Gloeobacter violaceus PCC 7421]
MGELRTLEGEVTAYLPGKRGLVNRCTLATPEGEIVVKFPKEWAYRVTQTIVVGERVQVRGKLKFDDDGETYLKATVLLHLKATVNAAQPLTVPLPVPPNLPEPANSPEAASPTLPKTRVLVCESSDCCKRGARKLIRNLEEAVERYGLADRVQIRTTGCMKHCKQGPNLMITPAKTRHTYVDPAQAQELLLRELLPKLE